MTENNFSNPLFFEYQEPFYGLLLLTILFFSFLVGLMIKNYIQIKDDTHQKQNKKELSIRIGIFSIVIIGFSFFAFDNFKQTRKTYVVDNTRLCVAQKKDLAIERCSDLSDLTLNWNYDVSSSKKGKSGHNTKTYFQLILTQSNGEVFTTLRSKKYKTVAESYVNIHLKAPELLEEAMSRTEFPVRFLSELVEQVNQFEANQKPN